jgi:hypothetical protein
LTQREIYEAGKRALLSDLQAGQEEFSQKVGKKVEFTGWSEEREAPTLAGSYSPMMRGEICRMFLGPKPDRLVGDAGSIEQVVRLMPGNSGSVLCIPEKFRDTDLVVFADREFPKGLDSRRSTLRFCIGGDGTPGGGFLCRVVWDHLANCQRLMLPTDPRALDSIIWVE